MEKIIEEMRNAVTLESYERASDAAIDFFNRANEEDREKIRQAMIDDADRLLKKADESLRRADDLIDEFHSMTPAKK